MPFESDRNVNITITVEDRDANARLEKIANSLERLADTSGGQLNSNLRGTTQALQRATRAADRGTSGFSNFQKNLITLDASLRVVRRGFNLVRNSIIGFFDSLQDAQEIEGLTQSFQNLQQSIGQDAAQSIENLRVATRGLVGDLDLMRAANEAVLLRVDDGTGKFNDLAAAAIKLGQATGRTATQAIGDLTQGIGRQSRLILDNLGIVVRVEEAYRKYAESVGIATKDLTEFEKQVAFTAEATRAIEERTAGLAEIQETAGTATQRLGAALSNLRTSYLSALSDNVQLAGAIDNLSDAFNGLTTEDAARDIAELSASLINLAADVVNNAVPALKTFRDTLETIIELAPLGPKVGDLRQFREEAEKLDRAADAAKNAQEALRTLNQIRFLDQSRFALDPSLVETGRQAVIQLRDAIASGAEPALNQYSDILEKAQNNLRIFTILTGDQRRELEQSAEVSKVVSRAFDRLANINLGEGFGDIANDVGKARVSFSQLNEAIEKGAKLTPAQSDEYNKLKAALDRVGVSTRKLTADERKLVASNDKISDSIADLAANIAGVPTEAEKLALKLNDLRGEFGKGEAAADKYAAEMEKILEELRKTPEGAKLAEAALKELDGIITQSERNQAKLAKGLRDVLTQLDEIPAPTGAAGRAVEELGESLNNGTLSLDEFKLEVREVTKELGTTPEVINAADKAIKEFAENRIDFREIFKGSIGAGVAEGLASGDVNAALDVFRTTLTDSIKKALADAFSRRFLDPLFNSLGDAIFGGAQGGGLFGGITSSLGLDSLLGDLPIVGSLFGDTASSVSGLGAAFSETDSFLAGLTGSTQDFIGPLTEAQTAAQGFGSGLATLGTAAAAATAAVVATNQIIDGFNNRNTDLSDFTGFNGGEVIGTLLGDLFGGREDPFRDARNSFESFISDLEESTGFDLGFDFDIGGFQEVIKTSNEVKEIFGETFENFTTQLDDGTFAVNQFSIEMAELGQTADRELVATFDGIGTSIAASMGLAGEELAQFGQQFGQLLAVNLEDPLGLNRLQLLFQQAGLSAEELGAAIEDAYFRGDISAGEFLNAQSKTENLFEQGIPGAVGATDAAFANLVTGGLSSGQEAMDAFGDLAVEATEKGITSFAELSASLIESGASVTDVNLLFEQLAANGITTIEALKEISLPQAAEMIADLEQVGFGFQEIGDQITTARELLQQFRAETTQPITQRVNVEFAVTGDQAAIDAGLTNPLPGNPGDGPPSGRVFFNLSNFSGEQP